MTTPTGSRTDGTLYGDGAGFDDTWNTLWDSEVTRTGDGWFAEMRIPFSSLRLQSEGGRVVMGLSAFRYLGRINELDLFPAIRPDWGFWSFDKPSQFQPVAFEGVVQRRPIYVTPYALGGLGQRFDLDDAETSFVRTDDPVTETGADLKVGLTDHLTLDLTLNTDFAQVEADDQQVNLTRFSLFFPEKRRFFLERASIFDVNVGSSNRLFYSRRIGLAEGQAVRLLGGGRVVGRIGAWDVGLLEMQTARFTEGLALEGVLPAENFGVVRLRRRAFNPNSTLGGIATSRVGEDGAYNVVYGLDGDVRLSGYTYVSLLWAQSFDDEAGAPGLFGSARSRAVLERRAYTGFSYKVGVEHAGARWRPDLGFELRQDYWAAGVAGWQGWGPAPGSPFARHRLGGSAKTYFRNGDGSVETVEGEATWEGQLSSGAFFDAGVTVTHDDLLEGFHLSDDAGVLPGAYTFAAGNASLETPRGRGISGALNAAGGAFYDGWRATAGVSPKWVASRFLEISGGYEFNRIAFPDRDQAFTAHVGRVRVQAALNTRLSAAAFVQINSAAEAGIANVRLRYNPREGTDLYLVFNEGFNTDRLGASPALPFTSQRALLAKYTYTFAF